MSARRSKVTVIDPIAAAQDVMKDVLEVVRFDYEFLDSLSEGIPGDSDVVIYSQREDIEDLALKGIANDLRRLTKAPIILMDAKESDNVRSVLLRRWYDDTVALPVDRNFADLTRWSKDLVHTIRALLKEKGKVENDKKARAEAATLNNPRVRKHVPSARIKGDPPECIAIGISTGGPVALGKLFPDFDPDILPPIFVVQHMPEDFVEGFARRLGENSPIPTSVPKHNEIAKPGHAYVAPGNQHLVIDRYLGDLRMHLSGAEPMSGHRPSADMLFHSLADHEIRTLGVIMTGMGADGAKGLVRLHDQLCHVIGQDEASCAVYGMPKAACKVGAVDLEMSLGKLPVYINELFAYINSSRKV